MTSVATQSTSTPACEPTSRTVTVTSWVPRLCVTAITVAAPLPRLALNLRAAIEASSWIPPATTCTPPLAAATALTTPAAMAMPLPAV